MELGVGDGCVTREILRRMRPGAVLLSVESNALFVAECGTIQDERLLLRHACATTLPELLDEIDVDDVDYVISSLPLAIMNADMVERILEVSRTSLRENGMFVQYQYGLWNLVDLARRYRAVSLGLTLWNLPPAVIYECLK